MGSGGCGRAQPVDQHLQAGGKRSFAVAEPDVLARGDQVWEASLGSGRKNWYSGVLIAGSRTRRSAIVTTGLAFLWRRTIGSRRCCIWSVCGMVKSRHSLASDRQGQLVERGRQAPSDWLVDRELVVASS
jgi:hypothetical protein